MVQNNLAVEIKKIANSNQTAYYVFNMLAHRRRYRTETDLDRFKIILLNNGAKIIDNDYLNTFKELEKQDLGSIVYGRGGNPTRFKWHYNLKQVGQAAIGNCKTW